MHEQGGRRFSGTQSGPRSWPTRCTTCSRPMRPVCFGVIATGACSSAWSSAAASSGGIRSWRPGGPASSTTPGFMSRGVSPTPARACASTRASRRSRLRGRARPGRRPARHHAPAPGVLHGFAAPGVDLALLERLALSPASSGPASASWVATGTQCAPPAGHIVRAPSRRRGCW